MSDPLIPEVMPRAVSPPWLRPTLVILGAVVIGLAIAAGLRPSFIRRELEGDRPTPPKDPARPDPAVGHRLNARGFRPRTLEDIHRERVDDLVDVLDEDPTPILAFKVLP